MKNSGYDELQVATRHRIAFHALILTFIVIMVNAWVKKLTGRFGLILCLKVWEPFLYPQLILQ